MTKNPKKMTYNPASDVADLYGATLKIIYHDGTEESIKIKSHKRVIPVKNKYNRSIKYGYYDGILWISYLEEQLNISMPTDISKLGNVKAITDGESKIEIITANKPARLYSMTAPKTGRYKMDFSGKQIHLKTGEQRRKTGDFTVYILDEDGYVKDMYEDSDTDPGEDETGLTEGEKYYFYVVIDRMEFRSGSGAKVIYKHEFSSKVSYLGDLAEQKITASDITKKYSKDTFFLNAVAESYANLSYSSSNEEVAVVSKDGEVSLKGLGTTKITIEAPAKGRYKAAEKNITLKVTKGDANINVKETSYTKALGSKAFKLGATAETTLTYKSSNTKVATVDKKGKVTIKGCGKTVITITAGNEKYKKSTKKVTVQVTPKTAKIKTAKSKKAGQLTLTWNKQKEAKGYVIEYSTDKNFKENVNTITIKKKGTVTQTLKNLEQKATYYVRVKAYVEISGKKIYGNPSKVKSVNLK